MRAVIDTGVLVSALLTGRSAPGQLLTLARLGKVQPLYSTEMLSELLDVLTRPRFRQKYRITTDDMQGLFDFLQATGEPVVPRIQVRDCRDPKDNKFLEAALAGSADCIVSGDRDLQVLTPWRGIEILSPAQAVERFAPADER